MEKRMRGKKTDPAFIAQFIAESVQKGMETTDQIVKHAKDLINQIDEEIKAIESKKIMRSKLLDVIETFEKRAKDTAKEAELLPFFDLQYPDVCKEICDVLKGLGKEVPINDLDAPYLADSGTIRFCYKQLLERKILSRDKDKLKRGERFDEYMTFVLREDQ